MRARARGARLALVMLTGACNAILDISEHDLAPPTGGEPGPGGDGGTTSFAGKATGGAVSSSAAAAGGDDAAAASPNGGAVGMDGGSAGSGGVAGSDSADAGAGVGGEGAAGSDDGGTCAPSCSGGKVCEEGACVCGTTKPDACGNLCTDLDTDASNCGRCGHSCRGAACADGTCKAIVLASGRTAPWALAVNSKGVYWLEADAVRGVGLTGGAVASLASTDTYVSDPAAIAANEDFVFYTNTTGKGNIINYQMALMKVAATGGAAPAALGKADKSISAPWGVAVKGSTVYWLDTQWQRILKTDQGTATESPSVVCNGTNGGYNYYGYVATDGTNAYWNAGSNGIFQAPLAGGALVVTRPTSAGAARVSQLGAQSGFVYFTTGETTLPKTTTPSNSTVSKIAIGGGGTVVPIASGLSVTPALAVDATGVYWSDGDIKRTPLAGGDAVVVAAGENAGFIALDSQFVYFTDATSGTVKKVAK